MREKAFIKHVQEMFPILADHALAVDIADAMYDASNASRLNMGSFEHDGLVYYVTTEWYDGCIKGDCNPATCWTDWKIQPDG